MAKIDATVHRALAARFFISGYPAIFFIHKGDVKKLDSSSRTAEGIKHFATEGWKKEKSLGFFTSPFSIIGKAKGSLVKLGMKVIELYYLLTEKFNVPWYLAGLIIGIGGLISVLVLGFFAVWLNTKDKLE